MGFMVPSGLMWKGLVLAFLCNSRLKVCFTRPGNRLLFGTLWMFHKLPFGAIWRLSRPKIWAAIYWSSSAWYWHETLSSFGLRNISIFFLNTGSLSDQECLRLVQDRLMNVLLSWPIHLRSLPRGSSSSSSWRFLSCRYFIVDLLS